MIGLSSLSSLRFRRTLLAFYALCSILPLLVVIYVFYEHMLPILEPNQVEAMRLAGVIAIVGLLILSGLGFFLLSWWTGRLEGLLSDIRQKSSELLGDVGADEPGLENEMAALRYHFDGLYGELQEKIQLLNQYSRKLIDENIKLSEMASTDELTGIYNRRHFDERLMEEVDRASRHEFEMSLIMVDLDGFKAYNDMYGHQAGDQILHRLGRMIRQAIRKSDLPFRYGGDEFAVILPQCGIEDATFIAQKLVRAVTDKGLGKFEDKGLPPLSISCGVASLTKDHEKMVADADRCLYKAKAAGRGRVVFASPKKKAKHAAAKENKS